MKALKPRQGVRLEGVHGPDGRVRAPREGFTASRETNPLPQPTWNFHGNAHEATISPRSMKESSGEQGIGLRASPAWMAGVRAPMDGVMASRKPIPCSLPKCNFHGNYPYPITWSQLQVKLC